MILEGVMLMFIGMGFVFIFLIIINVAIQISAKIMQKHTLAEEIEIKAAALKKREKNKKINKDDITLIAAITAAVKTS